MKKIRRVVREVVRNSVFLMLYWAEKRNSRTAAKDLIPAFPCVEDWTVPMGRKRRLPAFI